MKVKRWVCITDQVSAGMNNKGLFWRLQFSKRCNYGSERVHGQNIAMMTEDGIVVNPDWERSKVKIIMDITGKIAFFEEMEIEVKEYK